MQHGNTIYVLDALGRILKLPESIDEEVHSYVADDAAKCGSLQGVLAELQAQGSRRQALEHASQRLVCLEARLSNTCILTSFFTMFIQTGRRAGGSRQHPADSAQWWFGWTAIPLPSGRGNPAGESGYFFFRPDNVTTAVVSPPFSLPAANRKWPCLPPLAPPLPPIGCLSSLDFAD